MFDRSRTQVSVVIPTLPERSVLLERALASVRAQTFAPALVVEADPDRTGAGPTRNRALERVRTPLVAWLDDDDELLPHHLELLTKEMDATGADVVWPDFDVIGAENHRPSFIPITYLTRTQLVRDAGGFPNPFSDTWPYRYEDWGLLARMVMMGARFHHVDQVTWRYHIHGSNTVGTGM